MRARRLGTWLAMVAITLQGAWPLLVHARPRDVALVPLCTVDGVTHYLEVPTGNTPDDSTHAQHEHCGLCALGAASVTSARSDLRLDAQLTAERVAPRPAAFHPRTPFLSRGARAPPSPEVAIDD